MDILRTSSANEFAYVLGKAVFEQATRRGEKAIRGVVNALKSINGCFGYDPLTNLPTFSLSLGDISNPLYTLEEIFTCLEQAEKRCIVAIDEFQQIGHYPEKTWKPYSVHISSSAVTQLSSFLEVRDISSLKCLPNRHIRSITVPT